MAISPTESEYIATLYRFCAQSMQYPEFTWFTNGYLNALYDLLLALGATEETALLQQTFNESTNPLEDVQVEYTRLFINGTPHVVAPPYAGIYQDRSLRGVTSEKIQKFYLDCGYRLTGTDELPDSLVHQLEFLSWLATDQKPEEEAEFLRLYFLPWFPIFAARVKEEAKHPFYPVILHIIEFFTKEEEEHGV
jgi:TorA maturation chaperone TorD